jgi:DNA transformation protein and related proteins
MATRQSTIDFLLAQMAGSGDVRARAMFGEYALYCDDKVVALVCDDRLFLKVTEEGSLLLPDTERAPAYPGSKPHLVIEEDRWEDAAWLSKIVRVTADALPMPKKKKATKR